MNNLRLAWSVPWKAKNEIRMYFTLLPVVFYAKIAGVKLGRGCKFYGFPRFFKFRGSKIKIGIRFEDRNFWDSNPLGINHPTIICTWSKGAVIAIGKDVGISGGSIIAAEKIEIGDGTLIGANTTVIDTDFHPLKSIRRRYKTDDVRTAPIKIGNNVFIGMNCLILKGSVIPDNAVVPAGSIVRPSS